MPLLQNLFRHCAAMRPSRLTAWMTAVAIALAVPIGLGVWEILVWAGLPHLALMITITTIIVAVPLAGFLALTLAWGHERQQATARQQVLLHATQRIAKIGHWRWTCGTDYYVFSENLYPIFGLTPEAPRLGMEQLLEIMHPDDRAAVREAMHILLTENRPQEVEYRVRGADGTFRTLWVNGRCEYDAKGNMTAIFGVVQDITERKQIEMQLRDALATAEVASRAKSDFLASMSHELRTPLNAILGFSEMIRDQRMGPLGNERYVEYAVDIHDSGQHLLALIDGLLDIAKIEAGRYELNEKRLDLGLAIGRAVRIVQPVAARKQQHIELGLPDPVPVIVADERALHQILLNLLSNAIKFSYAGGAIRIRAVTDANEIVIAVEDRGIGIPPDKLAQIGQPFFQAHGGSARISGGTGIGLSVTRALTELHGGMLAIENRAGGGTRVTISLPASRLIRNAG